MNVLTQAVAYAYDNLIRRQVDGNGDGTFEESQLFVLDLGGKGGLDDVVLAFDESGNVAHRYLHGDGVDELWADESTTDGLLWALADRQGTVKDWAEYDSGTGTTSVTNHVEFDAYGNIISQTDASHEITAGGYTGRYHDPLTRLRYHRRRWTDPDTGWVSPDPGGFAMGDENLYRYVGNGPGNYRDPSGLEPPSSVWNPKYRPRDKMGLPTGLGEWWPSDFFTHSRIPASQAEWGCGGMMALRAGLPANSPYDISQVPDAMAFGSLGDALNNLENEHAGKGLVVGLERSRPYEFTNGSGVPIGPELTGPFVLPVKYVDLSSNNFCTLQGTKKDWYWEDATDPFRKPDSKIRHRKDDEDALREIWGQVIFIVVPNAPTVSPIPAELKAGQ